MSRKIFLSYARGDDEPFVWRLSSALQSAGFNVWFDRLSMPSRQLTFYQEIRDAVNDCDRLVLVVGPKAVASDYVSQEWRFAYFEAMKCVNPIVRLGGYDLMPKDLKLFHAEDFQDDAEFDLHLANLIRQLAEDPPPVGRLVGVPELPAHFVTWIMHTIGAPGAGPSSTMPFVVE
jgi:TIR domain